MALSSLIFPITSLRLERNRNKRKSYAEASPLKKLPGPLHRRIIFGLLCKDNGINVRPKKGNGGGNSSPSGKVRQTEKEYSAQEMLSPIDP